MTSTGYDYGCLNNPKKKRLDKLKPGKGMNGDISARCKAKNCCRCASLDCRHECHAFPEEQTEA
jgi:hypothetical protein